MSGLSESIVRQISKEKNEPEWMLRIRLAALRLFNRTPLPEWQVPDLNTLDFDSIEYYNPQKVRARRWKDVPLYIKRIYERMGIPQAERKILSGSIAQYQSESVYENLKKRWEEKGVVFCSMDEALRKYPELVRKYFAKCVPIADNKMSLLHYAVWSGGSFLYVPQGVQVNMPVQTYFYMKEKREGQFEHTIIVVEESATAHYIEGCTAPIYDENSLHAAVVEVYAKRKSNVKYTTVQNWSKNIYNLNTKRAWVDEGALMQWVSGSLGAKVSMLYPCSVLKGKEARATHLSITLASDKTVKEGGAKVIHAAPNTHSTVISKGISVGSGHSVYRGLIKVNKGAVGSTASVKCDSLLIGREAKSDTFPYAYVDEMEDVSFTHEATAGRISEEQLDYLMSRGVGEQEAMMMYVSGFISPVLNEVPLEYMIELNRFIQLEIERSVG